MSSFHLKPITYTPSSLRIGFFTTHSFSFFKPSNLKKNFKSSSNSLSYQQQQQPSQTHKPLKIQCSRKQPINPFWVLIPYILQCIKDTTISGTQVCGLLLKSCFEKWGSCFKGFIESNKALSVESLDIWQNEGKSLDFLQSGGIGMALLSVTTTAKVRISPFVSTLAANPTFVSAMLAWFSAQSIKIVLNFFVERKWDFRIMFASGGMPSSHSALCMALTTSVALCHGVADSLFPVCLGFSSVVMYDAIGVRRHAGFQAEVLNMIIADLFQGHPISQRKLKELLGHTPSQVLAGAILGILMGCICCRGYLVSA
ncbi:Acid phosphatase/vanadium-dependent haloperoxidase-related protein [Thalictrum thalictroides]|uniref:Acid phosphatase/vanadium-dependent haloperoxidase-related protein n=1 Tax=Thalictrum thalictroides TaxID=46969 RepID=A0A7J6VDS0_THATH|nr:Acid phosphatase/vanadium-dependent haloperoxidase-related protein [Thalictrum thalictroides]